MRKSFYHYILTCRGSKNILEDQLADAIAKDIQFPKHSENYHELSSYLEMNGDYLKDMTVFDMIWEKYVEINS